MLLNIFIDICKAFNIVVIIHMQNTIFKKSLMFNAKYYFQKKKV